MALAENILSVIENRSTGIFEAGTGTGKTLSYLVPAFLARGTVIVSTGTKNLQDQLFQKDVPDLSPLFPGKRIVVLKGRANYLCPRRLKNHLKALTSSQNVQDLQKLGEVRAWSSRTSTGDLTELLDLEEDARLLPLITSTRDNCLAGRCPDFNDCPLYRARERAQHADIVIVNHHLLFADIAQQEENLQAILPDAVAVVVDEAHQVADIARQFFGQRFGSGQVLELIRDTRLEMGLLGNDEPLVLRAADQLEKCSVRLREEILSGTASGFSEWLRSAKAGVIENLDYALEELARQLSRISDRSAGIGSLARRCSAILDVYTLLTESAEDIDWIHWIERRDRGFVIHLSPLSVANRMAAIVGENRAWVFLSATISVDNRFDHFASELGLETDIQAVFASPFNYDSAVRAIVPSGLPEPSDNSHTRHLVELMRPLIQSHPYRTFFLFTSHRALSEAAELMKHLDRPVLVQGTLSRSRLMDRFRQLDGAVLLGTHSFWEGVDARGAGLRCLIIDKLPFPSPGDPVFSALCRAVDSAGLSSFEQLSLPRAALLLKQGFGRLIREESDKGLFILGDSRMLSRSYGSYFRENLPSMTWTSDMEDAVQWLQQL